ncbi:MAG: bifunctional hydroxymethylpyrimidine kinase/phosphomethylpyrimidine kinase [Faecalibacterium sp.]|nr:bifunctional hydroxymethylpyrimidine kinase/phosphomethylpyrimidine kinase [Faecalibacterium sp.]
MPHSIAPKRVLCLHSAAAEGRCSTSIIQPVLAAMGCQPVMLPTVLLSTHTGGLGTPARLDGTDFAAAALEHFAALGLQFDCVFTGYLATPAQAQLALRAFALWPTALKVTDPVMGDNGRAYSNITPEMADAMRALCQKADLILPNQTEACLLLQRPMPDTAAPLAEADAAALAEALITLAPTALVTGLPMGHQLACAAAGSEAFVYKTLRLARPFHGTGDLFAAVRIGAVLPGNALSAAADLAAGFVSAAMQATPTDADERLGLWFEPLLGRLVPRAEL